jgi:hypothetical protein
MACQKEIAAEIMSKARISCWDGGNQPGLKGLAATVHGRDRQRFAGVKHERETTEKARPHHHAQRPRGGDS